MKIRELLKYVDCTLVNDKDGDVRRITLNSKDVAARTMFTAIRGFKVNGNEFGYQAFWWGAEAIMTDDLESLKKAFEGKWLPADCKDFPIPVIVSKDIRGDFSKIASIINGAPSEHMNVIGITGTKGKTTTSYMMRSIYSASNKKSGLIGTICNFVGDERIETDRTTPEANVIEELLAKMQRADISDCIMEVSSQSLRQKRVEDIHFSTSVWTNLSPDHIGASEHKDMNDYADAKSELFKKSTRVVLNKDNEWFDFMNQKALDVGRDIYTYSISDSDETYAFTARNIEYKPTSVSYDAYFEGKKLAEIFVPIPGRFTVYNSLSALAAMYLEGVSLDAICEGLKTVFVPGKAEIVPTGRDFTILIDYAHNPDSFINIITTVKEFARRTVFLFGCGGDRNRPRKLMGETAGKYADFTIITSDNPRSEDPESIVRDLEDGIKPTNADYVAIVNRREAIRFALLNARPGDVIILAGKGHETYQILKDKTIHFDEREVVREVLDEMAAKGM